MLPQNRRIRRKEIESILSVGKRYNSPSLLLYIAPIDVNSLSKQSRFAFSVSKKVATKAVLRNKYRRRGFSIISKYINQIKPGYFFFFSFKKGRKEVPFFVLEREIKELLSPFLVLV